MLINIPFILSNSNYITEVQVTDNKLTEKYVKQNLLLA